MYQKSIVYFLQEDNFVQQILGPFFGRLIENQQSRFLSTKSVDNFVEKSLSVSLSQHKLSIKTISYELFYALLKGILKVLY